MTQQKEAWGSRVGLILAMAGNAVGLGNFLRFPVQAIQNGGGAFIIPYLVCFLLMGIPLLWVEWASGRFGGVSGNHSTPFILNNMDKRKFWKYIGVFGIFTNLAVAAYYCYLESWTLSWVWHSVSRSFSGQSQDEVASFFTNYVSLGTMEPIIFWVICLLLNTWILSKGLSGGVEKVAKIGMPLLIVFGVFLAIMGVSLQSGSHGATNGGSVGLNFLWTPDFSTIWNPKVWLAAAGQIFFTLSVGMGSIQCYASYVRKKDDIALNAMSAGWMNEFVEVVLGAAIIIPISVGYLGIDRVVELTQSGGLGLGFRTLPYLFEQWGTVLAIICGVFWFGLLFFAGITSSLAMGTPWMGFMRDEFGWSRQKGAWSFGAIVLILGLPTVLFFNQGVFDEYDYWAGTVSLVVFALAEIILFSWVFGMNRGWAEITSGSDIRIPKVFRFIIKWVTPFMLLFVFLGALITPKGNDWVGAFNNGWQLDNGSIIKQITNSGLREQIAAAQTAGDLETVAVLDEKLLYITGARLLLLAVFLGIGYLVFIAYRKRVKQGRIE
ncbi:MAG: sodium-dependent transporter [Chitinophagales bacterium]|jgi:SNF family Na+-dependent transporter|nr:sodium-dependent transporter [Bacteroidota bacterium]MBK7569818.1 sodium-dependent transporter [Bacteroidota bacterium]MBP8915375.1 sodium-dependent transporter [Chitinophagales bacterium]MBP9220830.1 sodium-dependent transporter [Chitinophagales bacterium]MBP9794528.1 sodium-dependent transporter [Chitinophagales bacterium]